MARTNVRQKAVSAPLFGTTPLPVQAVTHEGGPAVTFTPEDQLRRAVLSCLLFESNFYESGQDVSTRIAELVRTVNPATTMVLARAARSVFNLRHVPLWLVCCLLKERYVKGIDDLIADVVQRADEPGELLSMYWKDGKRPLAAQLKRGLAEAVTKFDEYQCAKWGKQAGAAVSLRDVIFLCHAKPLMDSQAAMWKRLCNNELATPDTWETALSAGADKRETFTRLITERKLGYMALLRNLRNMKEAGVDSKIVEDALMSGAARGRALPFRFIAAARACPAWEPMTDAAMQVALQEMPKLPGRTRLLVDISGSMDSGISHKSDLRRVDAACALAILLQGVCESVQVYSFSDYVKEVPPRAGMALRDAIVQSQAHGGTQLGRALSELAALPTDRTIVITDEQSQDRVGAPVGKGYMIDVAGHQNGVGYGNWTWITGFSEAVVTYIGAIESDSNRFLSPDVGAGQLPQIL